MLVDKQLVRSALLRYFGLTCAIQEGRLWCINENWEVGRLKSSGFKSLGLLGNEFLVDLAFNPLDSSLWAVNRIVSNELPFLLFTKIHSKLGFA